MPTWGPAMTVVSEVPALRCVDVTARYGRIVACRGVSLDVYPAEILSLIGPNGAGKSSLARALAGLIRSTGEIHLNDRRIDGLAAHRRAWHGLAFVPEDRALFPDLTVQENLQLAGRLARGAYARQFDIALDLFPRLRERLAQRAGMLSGGEQQMLAIARALITAPQVLVLDEPTQGLAPTVRGLVADALIRLKDAGQAILLIEQNHAFATRVADRFVLMRSGGVESRGTRDDLVDRESMRAAYLSDE